MFSNPILISSSLILDILPPSMNPKILLVEDELNVISFIQKGLNEDGYEVAVANEGNKGLLMATTNKYDLIILDIMLPGMNGLEVCRQIRLTNKSVPVLFLTALSTPENVVLGLEAEADDYLAKPFKFIELTARIKNLIRRSKLSNKDEHNSAADIITFADLEINDRTKEVKRGGIEVSLTSTEYKLLLFFTKNPNRVLSRLDIMESVWGVDFDLGTNVVDVYVNYLRKKIEKGFSEKLIHTVIGMGYVLKEGA